MGGSMYDRVIYGNLALFTAPTLPVVTVAEVKEQSRIQETEEDDLIEEYIETATAHLEGRDGILGRALLTQTWDYSLPWFPVESCIALPLAPVQSITSITYKDAEGNPQTFGAANYFLSGDKNWQPQVHLAYNASWPSTRDEPDAVTIRAVYGYAVVPKPIKHAIVLLTAHQFENREPLGDEMAELPFGVRALLEPFMRTSF